jgi:transposase
VQRLTEALEEAVKGWCFEPVVAALRALRGIDTVNRAISQE